MPKHKAFHSHNSAVKCLIIKRGARGRPPFLHRLPKPANDNRFHLHGFSQLNRLIISSVLIAALVTALML